ncbi:hypothetical protein EOL73_03720 [Candidatus Saccharibacteria bacterium]|nr:hypothetical protein [Candidatus Saccharibacteria bacterium]NCU40837.1 hypothetical protein [Candidatus Saccharibacteria bacterium]
MLIPISRFIGSSVLSLQTGMPLARISEPIIDPRKLHVVAFRVIGANLSHAESVLHSEDIREFSEIGTIVDDDSSLMPLDDLVRLQKVLAYNFHIIGIKVITKKGVSLGRVASFGLDRDTYDIMQIYVQPSLLKSITMTGTTINRSQITAVNSERIIVKDAIVSQAEPVKKPLTTQSFVNPFRPQPQTKPTSTQSV